MDEYSEVFERLKALREQEKEAREAILQEMVNASLDRYTYRGTTYSTKVKVAVKYSEKLIEDEFDTESVELYKRKYAEKKTSMQVKRARK